MTANPATEPQAPAPSMDPQAVTGDPQKGENPKIDEITAIQDSIGRLHCWMNFCCQILILTIPQLFFHCRWLVTSHV